MPLATDYTAANVPVDCTENYRCHREAVAMRTREYVTERGKPAEVRYDFYCAVHRGALKRSAQTRYGSWAKDTLAELVDITPAAREFVAKSTNESNARENEFRAERAKANELRAAEYAKNVKAEVAEAWTFTLREGSAWHKRTEVVIHKADTPAKREDAPSLYPEYRFGSVFIHTVGVSNVTTPQQAIAYAGGLTALAARILAGTAVVEKER